MSCAIALEVFVFIIGAMVGSFLNVCIYRLPRQESIIFPSSHCVYCNHSIHWFDNIPFVSYILLRGRCRFCSRRISPRYFFVELLTALIFLALFVKFQSTGKFYIYSVLCAGLLIATFIDFEWNIIPDVISISGILIGLALSYIFPSMMGKAERLSALTDSFLGMLAGGLSIYAIGVLGKIAFKKEAMGGGDVKLLAMIGAFLGLKLVMLVFFLAPFFGSIVGIVLKLKYKIETIPYGPYISIAALVAIFWGDIIIRKLFFY